MYDPVSAEDQEIASSLQELAASRVHSRDPTEVAAKASAGPRRSRSGPVWKLAKTPAAIGLVAILLVSIAAFGVFANQQGTSSLASATVNDLDYTLAAARSLVVPPSALSPFGRADRIDQSQEFDSLTVYSLLGIDPKHALVIKLKPGQNDDAGPLGDFFLLVRGPDTFAELCPYFDKSSEATPSICQ